MYSLESNVRMASRLGTASGIAASSLTGLVMERILSKLDDVIQKCLIRYDSEFVS